MNQRYVVIDLETTGNSPKKGDRIIQIAAVVIENQEVCERFASFVNPNRDIPTFVENLTGISNDLVNNAPTFDIIAPDVISMLENAYFVAHNVPFDLTFLQAELTRTGFPRFVGPTLDTVELTRMMMPSVESYKLSQLADILSLAHENPHQADSDAEVTAEILLKLLNKLDLLPLVTCQKLFKLSRYFKSDIKDIINHTIELKMKKATTDDEQYYDIHRGIALRKLKDVHPKINQNLEFGQIKQQIQKVLETSQEFEYRLDQIRMMDTINNALESNQHSVIEAGTGLGKSLGYLLPAVIFANNNEKPVVISTNTIQLQQQLLNQDIPFMGRLLNIPINVAILKGKYHYISLRKFEQVLYDDDDNYDINLSKAQILIWLTETESGDVDELNLPSGGMILWNRINSSYENQNDQNPWHTRSFYERARQKANEAHLIITNHSLLFSDLTTGHSLLPPYDCLIIDEAHHIETVASRHFGESIDYVQIISILSQIGTLSSNGLLMKAEGIFKKVGLDNDYFEEIEELLNDIKIYVDELFRTIRSYVLANHTEVKPPVNRISYRYHPSKEQGKLWDEIIETVDRIILLDKNLVNLVEKQQAKINKVRALATPYQLGNIADYYMSIYALDNLLHGVSDLLLTINAKERVTWIEAETKGAKNATTILSQQIDVSDYLADTLFTWKKSVVLTSATLTVNKSFDFFIKRLGLHDFQPITLSVPSPFDYNRQTAIMIPTDLPDITSVIEDEYAHAIAIQIVEIAIRTEGRMLVLFTSIDMLRKTYEHLREMSLLEDYILIAQGISGTSKAKLTKNFKAFEKSILLGTNSFWEGVDIPGDDLKVLVIVRLPFSSPTDPVFAAKMKKIKDQGGNPFRELSLPEAIMRFKQGFGRLIRTNHDRGVVFVMDRRITSTNYGKNFLLSLPEVEVHEESLTTLLEKMDKWI